MCWLWFFLRLFTLHSQSSACIYPICMKQKGKSEFAECLKVHYVLVKVAKVGHIDKMTYVWPFVAIGHRTWRQLYTALLHRIKKCNLMLKWAHPSVPVQDLPYANTDGLIAYGNQTHSFSGAISGEHGDLNTWIAICQTHYVKLMKISFFDIVTLTFCLWPWPSHMA